MTIPLRLPTLAIALAASLAFSANAVAQGKDAAAILQEIKSLKESYERRTAELERKIKALETKQRVEAAGSAAPASYKRIVKDNSFNPSIGLVLNGKSSSFSRKNRWRHGWLRYR